MRKTFKIISAILALCFIFCSIPASAEYDPASLNSEVPYSYNYDWDNNLFEVPGYYGVTNELKEEFSTAVDMMIYEDNIYILTAKGIRVYDINKLQHIKTINSDRVNFNDAKGFFVSSDEIYITQYEKKKVLIIDHAGELLREFGEPKSSLVTEGFIYKPQKVIVQENGLVYVISDGAYEGLLQFDQDGDFIGFFGASKVAMTAELLLQQMWNKFMTQAQKDRSIIAVPTNYHGFCLDSKDLIYVCSASSELEELQVKKLSPYGNDITSVAYKTTFGDYSESGKMYNAFTDISVDERGIVSVLDSMNGKIFQYDAENHLLGVFGAISDQEGTFKKPIAIETYGDKVYVLDSGNSAVYVFEPTEYGTLIRKGVELYLNGRITQAEEYYKAIYKITGNISWVASGLGQAAMEREDYVSGMAYFKVAMDTAGYDQCFEAYRMSIISKYFWLIFIGIILIFVAVWIFASRSIKKTNTESFKIRKGKVKPWEVLAHPTIFGDIKEFNSGSISYATITLVIVILVRIAGYSLKGFLYNPTLGVDKNYLMEILQFILVYLCFIACVWAVGSFIEGKGKFYELYISYAYAFVPYCICGTIAIALSNVMTLREAAFVTGIETIGVIWTGLLIFIATLRINDYSFSKTILSLIGTIFAMVFVLFIVIMMATLIGKISSFVVQLTEEIVYKM